MGDGAREPSPSRGGLVAIGNLKGGVGKSTVAVGIAGAMASAGKSVALVDGDPQATSSRWLANPDQPTWSEQPIWVDTLDIATLSSVETWLEQAERLVRVHGTVLVDLPAVIGPAMAAAFMLARVIIVPVSLSPVDIDGTTRVLKHIRAARNERGGRGPAVLIVPNKLPRRIGVERDFADAFDRFGEPVVAGLSLMPEHGRAFAAGAWIGDIAPGSRAHLEVLALETALARTLEQTPPAPRLELARRARREQQRAEMIAALRPSGDPAATVPLPKRRWWQRFLVS